MRGIEKGWKPKKPGGKGGGKGVSGPAPQSDPSTYRGKPPHHNQISERGRGNAGARKKQGFGRDGERVWKEEEKS